MGTPTWGPTLPQTLENLLTASEILVARRYVSPDKGRGTRPSPSASVIAGIVRGLGQFRQGSFSVSNLRLR